MYLKKYIDQKFFKPVIEMLKKFKAINKHFIQTYHGVKGLFEAIDVAGQLHYIPDFGQTVFTTEEC